MSNTFNYYIFEIVSPQEINQINIPLSQLQEFLNPTKIIIVCYFETKSIFLWIGSQVNDIGLLSFSQNYAVDIKNQIQNQYQFETKIININQNKEPPEFLNLFNSPTKTSEINENDEKLEAKEPVSKSEINESNIQHIENVSNNLTNMSNASVIQQPDDMLKTPVSESNKNNIDPFPLKMKIELEKITSSNDPELPQEIPFEKYVQFCDEVHPYGIDRIGKAFLFPQNKNAHTAHRMDMTFRCDWGSLRKSGLGWRLNPTFFIALIFFAPSWIIDPLVYSHYGHPELMLLALQTSLFASVPYLIISIFLIKLIGYCFERFDQLLKPYGKEHESFAILWRDNLEYLKFEANFFSRTMNNKWMIFGLIGFLGYMTFGLFYYYLTPNVFYAERLADNIPGNIRFFTLIGNIGIGLIIFLIITFLLAIFRGLFILGHLANDRNRLSIMGYRQMIQIINQRLIKSQNQNIPIYLNSQDLIFSGRTFYEFQRGNRKIGELLFNISAILIFLCILAGVGIYLVGLLGLIPEAMQKNTEMFSSVVTIMGIMSFGVFILPQLNLHQFLKEYKYQLADLFAEMKSRFEFLYYNCLIKPDLIKNINPDWNNINDIQNLLSLGDNMITEIKSYGTWSYDFPEVIKVIVIAASTFIPLLLDFIPI